MKINRSFLMVGLLLGLLFGGFTVQANAQWSFQTYIVTAGAPSSGFPVTTAVVPTGSYIGPVGATTYVDPDGTTNHHQPILTYYTPTNTTGTETHYFISGACQGLRAPTGYRKIATWRNIYGVDLPDGTYDNSNEFCVQEIVPK